MANNYARTSYVISKDSINRLRAWFMVLIADTAYINGDFTKLNRNTYQSRDKNFSGRLIYYTPKGEFLSVWRYEKGVITKSLSVTTQGAIKTQSKQEVNLVRLCYSYPVTSVNATCVTAPSSNETSCTYTYTTIYLTDCYDIDNGGGPGGDGPGGGGDGGGGGGFPPPPPTPPDCPPINVAAVGGKQVNVLPPGEGGGGGGGGTNPCIVPQPDIINNVQNPCLKAMVNVVINKNITTVINTLIQTVFNRTTKVNITYVDVTTLAAGVKGFAPPPSSLDANGNLNIIVQLNRNELPSHSQEYIATVIMHESIHAYLTTVGSFGNWQHEAIATVFANQMALDLRQMYPLLSVDDAKYLPWVGLQSTDDFNTNIKSNLTELGKFDATKAAFSAGSSGTRCN